MRAHRRRWVPMGTHGSHGFPWGPIAKDMRAHGDPWVGPMIPMGEKMMGLIAMGTLPKRFVFESISKNTAEHPVRGQPNKTRQQDCCAGKNSTHKTEYRS